MTAGPEVAGCVWGRGWSAGFRGVMWEVSGFWGSMRERVCTAGFGGMFVREGLCSRFWRGCLWGRRFKFSSV